MQDLERDLEKLRIASRRAGYLAIVGVGIVVTSLVYSFFQLSVLERNISEKTSELIELNLEKDRQERQLQDVQAEVENSQKEAAQLRKKVEDLSSTQQSLLDFLTSVTDPGRIHILSESVPWEEVKRQIGDIRGGKRKNAILHGLLLAWKDIPFSLGGKSTLEFDSPGFLAYVLNSVGINIVPQENTFLSVTLMNQFEKTDHPKPGDLVFFRGAVGNFGFILAAVGTSFSEHVGIGTLETVNPLQVLSLNEINVRHFPLRGYYRVRYPDE